MNGIFALAGGFAFAVLFFFFAAFNAARCLDIIRVCQLFWIGFPLFLVFCVTVWIGVRYPAANFWKNQGFGPNWECRILGRGGAEVCFPDKP